MKTLQQLVASAVVVALLTPALSAQVRTKKVPIEKQSFPEKVAAAKAAFEAGNFSKSMKLLREATAIASAKLKTVVLSKMPAPPANYEKLPQPKRNNSAAMNPLVGLVNLSNIPIVQKYKATSGRGRFEVQVHVASATAKLMAASFQMAAFNDKLEIIKYNAHKGLLDTSRKDRRNLKILITSASDPKVQHFVDITTHTEDITEDMLFKMIDQKWVDELAKTLG